MYRVFFSWSHPDQQFLFFLSMALVCFRDVEAEAEAGSGGSGTFSVEVEAEARKIHRFRFHIGGKNGGRKEIGSAVLRKRTNRGNISFKK